jgi:heme exporter protein C
VVAGGRIETWAGERYGSGDMLTRVLGFASLLLLAGNSLAIFFVAKPIAVQGDAGRIVYFHVAMALVALFLAFVVVFVASIAYLRTGNPRWDRLGHASGEVGLVFTTLVLITGAIWGYPIWGTWWSWDPKLTTTLILWFMYLGYLMVRGYAEPPRGPRYAAIVGIVAFVDVPIVYLSSYWWRTLHPQPVIGPLAEQQPSASIVWLLLLSVVAFTVLYVFLVRVRYQIEQDEASAAQRGELVHVGA